MPGPGSAIACFGEQCQSFAAARSAVAAADGDWQSLLPQVTVRAAVGPTKHENCVFCNGSIVGPTEVAAVRLANFYDYSANHPSEVWNVACATGRVQKLNTRSLGFVQDAALRDRCNEERLRARSRLRR